MVTDYIQELHDFFNDSTLRCRVIFGLDQENSASPKLEFTEVSKEARIQFQNGFRDKVAKLLGKKPVLYSLSDEDSDTYLYVKITDISNRVAFLKTPTEKVKKLDENFVSSMRYMEFRFQNYQNKTASIFRLNASTNFLLKGKGSFLWSNAVLTPVREDIIVAHPEIHCAFHNETAIIFNRSVFETMFGYLKVFEADKKTVFSDLASASDYTIEDLKEIEAMCIKVRDLRALSRICQSGDYKQWSFDKLQGASKDRNVSIHFNMTNKSVKFHTKKNFFLIYDDNLVESRYTGNQYISFRKKLQRSFSSADLTS